MLLPVGVEEQEFIRVGVEVYACSGEIIGEEEDPPWQGILVRRMDIYWAGQACIRVLD